MLYLFTVMHQRRQARPKRWTTGVCRSVSAVAFALATAAVLPTPVAAHEIPERVAVRAFVQRTGTGLQLLVRVPLEAMRDLDVPLRDDGSLDLVRVRPLLREAAQTWIVSGVRITANGRALDAPRIIGARLALPNDRAFATLADARASFASPPLDSVRIPWQQPWLDVALEYPVPDADAKLVLHPDLAQLGIRTISVLHVVNADGQQRVLTYSGNPAAVTLDPTWLDAAKQFVRDGFRHILGGIDHLLFVLCLVLPVRRWQSLVKLVTAFTVAHSLTLGAAMLGFAPRALWFPPFIEVLIAASIVWLTIENIVLPAERLAERWPIAFGFGLVHGFGFALALSGTLQFAGGHLFSALASFNLGVELGQLAALSAALPVLWLVRRYAGAGRDRLVTVVGSALIAHSAWHWLTVRVADLAAHRGRLSWPAFDGTLVLAALRIALLVAVAIAAGLAMRQIFRVPRRWSD
jgi:HupE / UreJ protein